MTESHPGTKAEETQIEPETLELRARPQPVTRINRKVLIGGAAVFLMLISGIVLVALKPPSLRVTDRQELINVENKPITDGLSRLPATYDAVQLNKSAAIPTAPQPAPQLVLPKTGTLLDNTERAEKTRLARMAGQARESQVFFRLQLKAPPQASAAEASRSAPVPGSPGTATGDGNLATLSLIRAAERGRAFAAADLEPAGTDATEGMRKLTFLKSGPEKDIYNPHGLQTPASPYQLMAGTVIAASLVRGLNSDLPGFVIAQVTERVYDTVAGRFLLIPQGSRLIGKYDNVVAFGQERALVVWQRIILPDGSSVVIDNLPATDTGGYAGLADQVDLHTWQLLKGARWRPYSELAASSHSAPHTAILSALCSFRRSRPPTAPASASSSATSMSSRPLPCGRVGRCASSSTRTSS